MCDCFPYVGTGRTLGAPTENHVLDAVILSDLRRELSPGDWLLMTATRDDLEELAGRHGYDPRFVFQRRARLRDELREKYREE